MDCSMPDFPVLHYLLLKFMSIESVMLSNHLIFCHPFLLFLHHQGLFQCNEDSASDAQSIGALTSASVLPMNIQGWFPLGLTRLISVKFKGFSRVFFSTRVWKHQFFAVQPSLWSNSHIHTWLLEKLYLWLFRPLLAKWCLCFLICCLGLSKISFQGASVF